LGQVQKQQDEDDLDDLDEIPEGTFDADKYDDYKMVLVVRTDLGMTKGKMAAQVHACHTTKAVYSTYFSHVFNDLVWPCYAGLL
jgi:PTH2 family peptidyl-tRNA hydrolase